ncbi:hypothetical protein KM799_15485 [Clostridium tyrobutyricum]|jgi:hypothetical protein|uniref:hypothetical protein n=1 Tax=Clostridium tyrobutyricum TaxID=1519 RepID=UPI0010AAAAB1|nr:hypothetical protein [Clostridium tyrobutyricum]MBV4447991.1 hypothetical protein [Clostridium tyrobutyricum]QCH28483.1 hypothetical protein EZN00_02087 [Clostridium tyrobutyricum]
MKNISFKEACNIIKNNKIDNVYYIEGSKEKDCGKPKSKDTAKCIITFFECGDAGAIKSIAPMIAIKEDMVSEITFDNKELTFEINSNIKYRVVIS